MCLTRSVEVIVLTNSDIAMEVQKYVAELHKGKIKTKFEVLKPNMGTAEALLKIKDKIKVNKSLDFMVI
jgi:hypothetical protein